VFVSYDDILSRIAEPPKWWSGGVPRYLDFTPEAAGVYGAEVLLVRSACQLCHAIYDIAVTGNGGIDTFRDNIDLYADVALGDPPNACCGDGAHMLAVVLQVLEFWERGLDFEFQRLSEHEVYLDGVNDLGGQWVEAAQTAGGIKSVYHYLIEHNLYDRWDEAWLTSDKRLLIELCDRSGCARARDIIENGLARKDREEQETQIRFLSRDQRQAAAAEAREIAIQARDHAIRSANARFSRWRGTMLAYSDKLIAAIRYRR
jgi:hypothetical protein